MLPLVTEFLDKPSGSVRERLDYFVKACGIAIDWGSEPWQPFATLLKLRNELVHARPLSSERGDAHADLEKSLFPSTFPGRYPLRPGMPESATFFPHRLLGGGSCDWAINTARAVARDFVGKAGMRAWGGSKDDEVDRYRDSLAADVT
jgi:hypothetical protein